MKGVDWRKLIENNEDIYAISILSGEHLLIS